MTAKVSSDESFTLYYKKLLASLHFNLIQPVRVRPYFFGYLLHKDNLLIYFKLIFLEESEIISPF